MIFDNEFIGGKDLNGNCSPFRGRLCRWSGLLLISRPEEYREFMRKKRAAAKALVIDEDANQKAQKETKLLASMIKGDNHVKGQFPANNAKGYVPGKVKPIGHVSELIRGVSERVVGPEVSVKTVQVKVSKNSDKDKLEKSSLSIQQKEKVLASQKDGPVQSSAKNIQPGDIRIMQKEQPSAEKVNPNDKSKSLMNLLQKKLNIDSPQLEDKGVEPTVDKPVTAVTDSSTQKERILEAIFKTRDTVNDVDGCKKLSNGSGRLILAEAAGFDLEGKDFNLLPPPVPIFDHPMAGVITYDPAAPQAFNQVDTRKGPNFIPLAPTMWSQQPQKGVAVLRHETIPFRKVLKKDSNHDSNKKHHNVEQNLSTLNSVLKTKGTTELSGNKKEIVKKVKKVDISSLKKEEVKDLGAATEEQIKSGSIPAALESSEKNGTAPEKSLNSLLANARRKISKKGANPSHSSDTNITAVSESLQPLEDVAKVKNVSAVDATDSGAAPGASSITSILKNAKKIKVPSTSNLVTKMDLEITATVQVADTEKAHRASVAEATETERKILPSKPINSIVPTKILINKKPNK